MGWKSDRVAGTPPCPPGTQEIDVGAIGCAAERMRSGQCRCSGLRRHQSRCPVVCAKARIEISPTTSRQLFCHNSRAEEALEARFYRAIREPKYRVRAAGIVRLPSVTTFFAFRLRPS